MKGSYLLALWTFLDNLSAKGLEYDRSDYPNQRKSLETAHFKPRDACGDNDGVGRIRKRATAKPKQRFPSTGAPQKNLWKYTTYQKY